MIDLIHASAARLEDYLRSGGPVMVPLIGVSVVMWLLILDRVVFFRHLLGRDVGSREARALVAAGRRPDPNRQRGAVAALVAEFLACRSGRTDLDRFILDQLVARFAHRLTDHLALIGVLAAVAPLLGLLGTVTGMITIFDVLAVHGAGNAQAMASGISEALITTETGLVVAIPGLYMKGFLDRRAKNLAQRLDVVGFYLRRHL